MSLVMADIRRPVGFLAEEGDGLLDDLGIEKIAQVAHHRVADVIDEIGGKEFRNPFGERHANNGDGHDGPNIVDPVGKYILEVNACDGNRIS